MGYFVYFLAAIIVLFFEDTSNLTFEEGADMFLNKAEGINEILFWICLVVWVVAIVLTVASTFFGKGKRLEIFSGCGCVSVVLFFLPIIRLIVWQVNAGMANNWDASGPTDPTRFALYFLITLLLGSG
jgi:hypothetical protein